MHLDIETLKQELKLYRSLQIEYQTKAGALEHAIEALERAYKKEKKGNE